MFCSHDQSSSSSQLCLIYTFTTRAVIGLSCRSRIHPPRPALNPLPIHGLLLQRSRRRPTSDDRLWDQRYLIDYLSENSFSLYFTLFSSCRFVDRFVIERTFKIDSNEYLEVISNLWFPLYLFSIDSLVWIYSISPHVCTYTRTHTPSLLGRPHPISTSPPMCVCVCHSYYTLLWSPPRPVLIELHPNLGSRSAFLSSGASLPRAGTPRRRARPRCRPSYHLEILFVSLGGWIKTLDRLNLSMSRLRLLKWGSTNKKKKKKKILKRRGSREDIDSVWGTERHTVVVAWWSSEQLEHAQPSFTSWRWQPHLVTVRSYICDLGSESMLYVQWVGRQKS